jgi:glycosyltransferase involved in cell wall biosynthesis
LGEREVKVGRKTIINIIPHTPPYDLYRDESRPAISWEMEGGGWVGIWGYDWPDLLGREVLRLTDEFEYEVWQPDLRADRVYDHYLEGGVRHFLFPAGEACEWSSLWRRTYLYSRDLIECVKERTEDNVLLHLNDFRGRLSRELYKIMRYQNVPILVSGHGSTLLPLEEAKFTRNPLAKMSLLWEHFQLKKLIGRVNHASEQNEGQIAKWTGFIGRKVDSLTMGCDFEFWHPNDDPTSYRRLSREVCGDEGIVFVSACNFIPRKQLDKIIITFLSLIGRGKFCLVLVGHGKRDYKDYLMDLGRPLVEKGQLVFVDYSRKEKLREIYWSSDVFLSLGVSEGASVAAMEALGCGLRIITTENNGIGDTLRKYNSGLVLRPSDYTEWREQIGKVLDGFNIELLPIETARDCYHWSNVAERFIERYQRLFWEASRK